MRIYCYFIVTALLIASCQPYPNGNGNGDGEKIPIKGAKNGVEYDYRAKPSKKIILEEFEQEAKVKKGETVELFVDSWLLEDDDGEVNLRTKTNPNSDSVTIGIYNDAFYDYVKLNKKCDVVEVRGTEETPMIKINENLNPEQIVLTPLFDDSCIHYGFQIRYGSTGRGCYSAGKEVLQQFNRCVGKPTRQPNNEPTCLEKVWFGIDCP